MLFVCLGLIVITSQGASQRSLCISHWTQTRLFPSCFPFKGCNRSALSVAFPPDWNASAAVGPCFEFKPSWMFETRGTKEPRLSSEQQNRQHIGVLLKESNFTQSWFWEWLLLSVSVPVMLCTHCYNCYHWCLEGYAIIRKKNPK